MCHANVNYYRAPVAFFAPSKYSPRTHIVLASDFISLSQFGTQASPLFRTDASWDWSIYHIFRIIFSWVSKMPLLSSSVPCLECLLSLQVFAPLATLSPLSALSSLSLSPSRRQSRWMESSSRRVVWAQRRSTRPNWFHLSFCVSLSGFCPSDSRTHLIGWQWRCPFPLLAPSSNSMAVPH